MLLLVTGCAGLRTGAGRPPEGPAPLSESELASARSLANYTSAILEENRGEDSGGDALALYLRSIELHPGPYRPYARAVVLLLKDRKLDEAVALLEKAVAANPGDPQPVTDLAAVCEAARKTDDAIRHYANAIALSPKSAALYCQAARICLVADRDRQASDWLKRGYREADQPGLVSFFCYNAGVEFVTARQLRKAVTCFETLLDIGAGDSGQIHILIAELQEEAGNTNAAVKHLTAATRGLNPDPNAFVRLAAIQAHNDTALAAGTLAKAMAALPGDPSILYASAMLLSQQKEYGEAIRVFARAEDSAERKDLGLSEYFYVHYGAAFEQSGQIDKAAEVFRRGLAVYQDSHAMMNYMAYMWADAGINLDESEKLVKRALELDPENGAYVDTLGWIYYRQKRYEEAAEQIAKADTLIPEDPTILDHLGDVMDALQRTEDAVAAWKRSHSAEPSNASVAEKLRRHGIDTPSINHPATGTTGKKGN